LKIVVADGAGSDIPVQPGSSGLNDQVSVNGFPVKGVIRTTTLPPVGTFGGSLFLLTIGVNIEYLKFPHRAPGSVSLEVQNGAVNLVSISPDLGVFPPNPDGTPMCGTEQRNPQIGPIWVEFQAMSPVILATGCCGETLAYWRNNAVGSTLFDEFQRRNLPFADHDSNPNNSLLGHIDEDGKVLAGQVVEIAREFGANWVHLVAHSKGGLNAR
jgi:hypothetical protein